MKNISKFIFVLFLILPFKLFGIGWQIFGLYRSSFYEYRDSAFNPNGFTVNEIGFKNRNYYFSQYLGLNDKLLSFDWQFDVLGTSDYDKNWENNLRVKQFYFQIDFFQNLDLMVGRSILRWGTGYAFNPTNVVPAQKELSDPDNIEKRMPGNDLIKLEYFDESYSIALAYLTNLKFDKKLTLRASRLAFRFYKNIWELDLSLISLANRDAKPIWGSNFSYVIGERLEIHGEIATQRGSCQNYHRATIDENTFYLENPIQPVKQNDEHFYNQYLVGVNYTFFKNINWILEYYHQDQGYSKREWKRIIDYVGFLNNYFNSPLREVAESNLLWSLSVFSPKGAMRDYLMNYVNIPGSPKLEFKLTSLINLNDGSLNFIPEIDFILKNHFTFYGRSFIFKGKKTSEFGELFQSFSIEGGIRFSL